MFRSPRDVGYIPAPKVYKKYDKEKDVTIELYGCDMCTDGGWTSETEVEIHKTRVHYKKEFMKELRKRDDYCFICIKKCQNKESVVRHIKTEHLLSTATCQRVERETFICNECSAIFFNKQNLDIHLRYAHLNMSHVEHIKCVLCMKRILLRNMPAHFYFHNIQSVSTCRICLCKYKNTKVLEEHLKTHPYYLKCEMCYYETGRVEAFQNHILLRHRNSVKVNNTTTDDKKLMTVDNDTDKSKKGKKKIIAGELKSDKMMTEDSDDYTLIDKDFMTVIEISDLDTVIDNTSTIKNLMTDSKINKEKFKKIKKKGRKKKKITTKSTTAVNFFIKDCAMKDTNIENAVQHIDKGLMTLKNDDPLITIEDLMTDKDKDNLNSREMGNLGVTSNNLMKDDAIKNELTDSNLMLGEVMSDSNFMTVIEISGQDVTATNTTADSNLTENVNTDKDFVINDVTISEVNVAADSNLTDNVNPVNDVVSNVPEVKIENDTHLTGNVNPVNDLVSNVPEVKMENDTNLTGNINPFNDLVSNVPEVEMGNNTNLTGNVKPIEDLVTNYITITEVNIENYTNLIDNVKPIKGLRSNDEITVNTDNVVSKPVKDSDDFKRFFIPDSPSFLRLQRIPGIKGIRLSNDIHICILCREICVGVEEMKSHVDEHTVKMEKSNSYECSCGEKFTNKVLLKHHAFKSKHVTK